MTRPRRYIVRMSLFVAAVLIVAGVLAGPIQMAFMSNPWLNGIIIGVALIGCLYTFRQVLILGPEVRWMESMRRNDPSLSVQRPPILLAPIAKILGDRSKPLRLSTLSLSSLLDSISLRLDEGHEISRYMINLLIFLGLLGTFYGLLITIGSVGAAINALSVASGDFTTIFDDLKTGLEGPLDGMGTAFSSSLFGLAGSLVLGFLDLQANQAQNRFYRDLEEWLTSVTKFSSGSAMGDGDQSVPAYVQALLEQTADSLDNLQRTLSRSEEGRGSAQAGMYRLIERLTTLTDQMRSEQELMVKLAENQMELRPVLQRLNSSLDEMGLDQASRNHIRNLDVYVMRILEESAAGREQLVQEVRSEIKLLARTIAAIAEDDRRG
ncbi:flagellar motor protein MotA [Oceanibacterium hippocampi]|nr:flagellar motor protein MotA [Oceanibacterium hippocampi]